jgi:hypothetical protein
MRIEVIARGYVFIRYITSALFGVGAAALLVPKGQVIIAMIIFGAIAYFLYRLIGRFDRGKVELDVLDSGLNIVWLKQLPLFNKESRLIQWNEIQDYVFQPEQYFDVFRIRLKDKTKIKLNLNETTPEFFKFLQ